ncbi:hypothetical protein BJ741DRAFT_256188 [Chytriomyces cf. hyalinus JEL632]|nr:hypothetical protein BJ741DRAFT_256188 [Chytriomyces cf. hyalinus JEL632]
MNQLRNFLENLNDQVKATAAAHQLKLQRTSSTAYPSSENNNNAAPHVLKSTSNASNRSLSTRKSLSNLIHKSRNSQHSVARVYPNLTAPVHVKDNDDETVATEPNSRSSTSSSKSATDSAISVSSTSHEKYYSHDDSDRYERAEKENTMELEAELNALRKSSLEIQCDIRQRLVEMKRNVDRLSESHHRLAELISNP